MSDKIHQFLTDQLIEMIEQSDGEFVLPWHHDGSGRPKNIVTKKAYRGINMPMLLASAYKHQYQSNIWGTFAQWKKKHGKIRKGEKATRIVFYDKRKVENDELDDDEETRSFYIIKYAFVFNRDQVDIDMDEPPVRPNLVERIQEVDTFIVNTGAEIEICGDRAFYSLSSDSITMPEKSLFIGTKTIDATTAWYATLTHELVHWSGPRCNRDLESIANDINYAKEELVADFGSAFLCAVLRISTYPRPDHAHYLKHWPKIIKEDNRAIFKTAALAEKAVSYLHDLQNQTVAKAA